MTKFTSRIATGIAILGLAAPAFAATDGKSMDAPSTAQTSPVRRHSHKHNKVASATEKVDSKKTEKDSKKTEKKVEKKGAVKSTKTETPAAPSATPAPASK